MPELKRIESGKLLCLEAKGALRDAAKAFKEIEEYLKTKKVSMRGERLVIVYDDLQTLNREQAHYAAAVELSGECNGDGDMTVVVQGTMLVAHESHRGVHESMGETYQRLLSWIQDKGLKVVGPAREFYLVQAPSDETAWVTEIQIPIQKPYVGEASGA